MRFSRAKCTRCHKRLAENGSCRNQVCSSNTPTGAIPEPTSDGRTMCPACQANIEPQARFCVSCGIPISASAAYEAVTSGVIPMADIPEDLAPETPRVYVPLMHKSSGVRRGAGYDADDESDDMAGNGS